MAASHMRREDPAVESRSFDGRLLIPLAVIGYLTAVSLARALWGVDLWRWFGVPSMDPIFFDARNITSAITCHARGLDPLVENPCDLAMRPMNYPRIWLALRWLGVGDSTVVVFGVIVGAGFLWAVWVLVGRLRPLQGGLVAVAMCSPAVMFAVERGQSDLVAFVLVVLGVLAWRTGDDRWRTLSPLPVFIAAVLKLFPVVALGAFVLARHTRAAWMATLAGLTFVVYAFTTYTDIRSIAYALPQGQDHAYGVRILPAALYHQYISDRWGASDVLRQGLAAVPLLAFVGLAWWLVRHRDITTLVKDAVDWRVLAMCCGALIYLGTFATANNWDYRLVFLLLTLPWALRWVAEDRLARWTLYLVLLQLYIGGILRQRSLADEIVSWLLAALLSLVLVRAMFEALRWLRIPRRVEAAG